MLLTKGGYGINIESEPVQQMLSYLIAIEVEKIIDSKTDFRNCNFDLNLILKDMGKPPRNAGIQKSDDSYGYTMEFEGS